MFFRPYHFAEALAHIFFVFIPFLALELLDFSLVVQAVFLSFSLLLLCAFNLFDESPFRKKKKNNDNNSNIISPEKSEKKRLCARFFPISVEKIERVIEPLLIQKFRINAISFQTNDTVNKIKENHH